jgi:hypothetical protein
VPADPPIAGATRTPKPPAAIAAFLGGGVREDEFLRKVDARNAPGCPRKRSPLWPADPTTSEPGSVQRSVTGGVDAASVGRARDGRSQRVRDERVGVETSPGAGSGVATTPPMAEGGRDGRCPGGAATGGGSVLQIPWRGNPGLGT